LLDVSFFNNPANAPKPYVALNVWNFAGAKGLGVQFAQNVDTPAALDGGACRRQGVQRAELIAAQVDALRARPWPAAARCDKVGNDMMGRDFSDKR